MKRILLLLAAALFAAGCQSPVTSGESMTVLTSGDRVVGASLRVDDPGVARHVSLTGATTALASDGFLHVQAHLTSTDHRDYAVQYKFRFFDANGMQVFGPDRPWQVAMLHGGEDFRADAVAPALNVASFIVMLRPAN